GLADQIPAGDIDGAVSDDGDSALAIEVGAANKVAPECLHLVRIAIDDDWRERFGKLCDGGQPCGVETKPVSLADDACVRLEGDQQAAHRRYFMNGCPQCALERKRHQGCFNSGDTYVG